MARFTYRLQGILNIKNQLETQAKMEFGQAQAKLNAEEEKLEIFKNRRLQYLEEGRKLRDSSIDVLRLKENEQSVKSMDVIIEGQMEAVKLAARNVEKARVKLTEAMQERKAQEKLRERAFEEFVEDEKHAEAREIDELVTYRHGRDDEDNGS